MDAGTTVLITGAASGIGACTSRALYRRGATLIVVDVDEAGLAALSAEFDATRCVAFRADVRDFDAVQAAVNCGVHRFGRLDAVVANAGVGSWIPVLAMQPTDFRRVIDINLVGAYHTARAALPALIASHGYVLMVASVASYVAAPGLAAYTASNAGVEQFANALRLEVAAHGVDVGSAHMAWVKTSLFERAMSESVGFAGMLAALPQPLRRTLSAEQCGERLAAAVARRGRHLAMPGWVSLARWVKPLLSTPIVERHLQARTRKVMEDWA